MNQKKFTFPKIAFTFFVMTALGISLYLFNKNTPQSTIIIGTNEVEEVEEKESKYDGVDLAVEQRNLQTRDLSTGKVPTGELWKALVATNNMKQNTALMKTSALSWIERGPNSDVVGPSNGNTRANGAVTAGRIRTIMVDSLDPTRKTVWVGSVAGGLWKTTDINASPANWQPANDLLSNLAIADICQDPTNGNIMYFATGESYFNGDAVQGIGVFKSTDHGVTWNLLSSTTSYVNGTRILCDYQGNVYLATSGNGLLRSTNGGTSWTTITPSGLSTRICDLEITSTATASRLHVVAGIFSVQAYRYTDNPATASSADWSTPSTPFPSFSHRAEITVSGNTLYALPVDANKQVPTIYKSVDGGANWTPTNGQPTTGWASGQGWYALSAAINPNNSNECIVGGLDCYKTTNGGDSWTKISAWVGTAGQYVHADQHDIAWYDGGNKLLFACDGGIHYSTDGGTTIRDRNVGLRVKQFYSVAIHPTSTNYFLAGAQDNGNHQLNNPGLGASVEVIGGDGAYVDIDQDEPQFQYGAYVYNTYRRSTNGGANWGSVTFSSLIGQFINPFDYDNLGNKLYASYNNGTYLRWENPQTGSTSNIISIPSFNNAPVAAVHVSPFTPNQVYFGTTSGRIVKVTNADQATPVDVNITGGTMPAGYLNCVNTGSSDQFLVVCYSNYNTNNIWVSTDGGANWTTVDGNLPNMPVNWAMFHPDTDSKMIIATEAGVWETDLLNGASTAWVPSTGFPSVRTDMLQYRASDRLVAAGTHGRGVWSAIVGGGCSAATITTQPTNTTVCNGSNTSFSVAATGASSYQWQISTNAGGLFSNITNGGVYSGATSATLNISNTALLMSTYQYKCIVTSSCGAIAPTTAAELKVNTPVSVAQNASSVTICATGNTSFTVAANGTSPTYKWQESMDSGITFTNIPNAENPTLNLTGVTVAMNGRKYRCVITGTAPCSNTVNTTPATLTVSAQPTVILSVNPLLSLLPGLSSTLTATSNLTNNVSYTWYKNNTAITNITNTYPITVNNIGTYSVKVTDLVNGCFKISNDIVIKDSVTSKLFIYPSPNNGQFTVSYYNTDGSSTQTIAVFDAKGSRVYYNKFPVAQVYQLHPVNITNNRGGQYFVIIGDANGKRLAVGEVTVVK
jgi:Secretion system C-terminal sorting domain